MPPYDHFIERDAVMKKVLPILLITFVFFRGVVVALASEQPSFPKVQTYTSGQFDDIPSGYPNEAAIRTVYEYGIMGGTDQTHFAPNESMTYAQALVISCRLHGLYYGNDTSFSGGNPWYQPYVDYAAENDLSHTAYPYEEAVIRSDFAVLLGAAFPDEALPEINTIEDGAIPDVAPEADDYASIYRLYRAGILTGNNAKGDFTPSRSITREEVAVIAGRMLDASLRKQITLKKESTPVSTEERLYEVIKAGIENKVGLTFVEGASTDDYINLSEFGLSNEEGSEDRELLWRVFKEVFYENPQFFYLNEGYWRKHSGSSLTGVIPMYYEALKDEDILAEHEAAFQAAVEEAMKQVDGVTDPVAQLLILHDFLAQKNLYNWDIAADSENWDPWWARSSYGALTGDCVCKGYALAYKLLLNNLGIHSAIAVNESESHVWNVVELDGEWYHVDIDWDCNPFPTLSGRCYHDYFLVSDDKLQSMSGNHAGWKAYGKNSGEATYCSSTKYESGWAFNDQVNFPVYQKGGVFYYITQNSNGKFALYRGSLTESGTMIAELPIYTRSNKIASGVVWLGDQLYYVDTNQNLVCLQLSNGKTATVGKIPFTPASSQDGLAKASRDGIGLRYDGETGELAAISSTRRVDLARFSISSSDD